MRDRLIEKQEVLGAETEGIVRDKKGNPKPDTKLRDHERVPLTEDIDDYYQREVKPHVPESWIDRKRDKVGYEINFQSVFLSVHAAALTEGNYGRIVETGAGK